MNKTRRLALLLPRLVRFRDAPHYLGMDRNRFNVEVRPGLTEIPIGRQGIAFDRLELDAWVDDYVSRNGRPAAARRTPWDVEERRASPDEVGSGTLINTSRDTDAFARALARVDSRRPKRY
ncbi:MAG: hypothetical protein R3268_04385 [Acidiferrobacterales bacterium]|nr:hypothetical protein [Acidiferrobacterales bacterium]